MSVESINDSSNFFVHPVPVTERYRRALVGSFERLPHSVVDEVILNTSMQEGVTDPNLLKWFDKDYLLQRAAVFSLGRSNGPIHRVQTPTSHRAVLLQKDNFFTDEYGNGFGEISVKGTGVTKYSIHNRQQELPSDDPLGFFGAEHAKQEGVVSNQLAEAGARVGRVIARINLNADMLMNWLETKTHSKEYSPVRELSKVIGNNDTPALLVRLQGTDRLEDWGKRKYYYGLDNIYRRAARLLLREMHFRGQHSFFEHYRLSENKQMIDGLKRLSGQTGPYTEQGIRISAFSDAVYLREFYNASVVRNKKATKIVSAKYYNKKLTSFTKKQDIDFAGFIYDFETYVPGTSQYMNINDEISPEYPNFPLGNIFKEMNRI